MKNIIISCLCLFLSSVAYAGKGQVSFGATILSSSAVGKVKLSNGLNSVEANVDPSIGKGVSASVRGNSDNSNVLLGVSGSFYNQMNDNYVIQGGLGFYAYGQCGNHVHLGFVMDFSFYYMNVGKLERLNLEDIWGLSLTPRFRIDIFPVATNYNRVNFSLFVETGIEFIPWAGSSYDGLEIDFYQARPILNLGVSFM